MAKNDLLFSVSLPAVVTVMVNGGRGTDVAHLLAWHDEENAVIKFHGVGGDLNRKPAHVIPVSDIVEVH